MSDAVLQELIVRLASDEGFAGSVRAQPTLLDAYDLDDAERAMLLSLGADAGPGASGLAERQSKSSLLFMGAGHHVEGHVNLGHTGGMANPGPVQHDLGSTNPGPIQHDPGHIQHDVKLHEGTLGADKAWSGPITHDVKLHDALGADKWHEAGRDPGPIQHDAKVYDTGIGAAKMHDAGIGGNLDAAKVHEAGITGNLDAAKVHEAGIGADKLGSLGDDKLGGMGTDKLGFTGGVKIDTELGGGG